MSETPRVRRRAHAQLCYRRALLICLAAALPAGLAYPADALAAAAPGAGADVGRAEVVVPSVRGHVGELTRELAAGDEVHAEEAIESGAGSAARIRFRDGTELAVGPSSRVVIDRFVYDPGAGTGRLALGLVSGLFEFVSGALNPASYELRTPGGQLSVRGTRIVIDTGRDLVAVTEGTVVVRPDAGETVTISAGECLVGGGSGRRVGRGSTCSDALGGYRSMVSALAGVPGQAVAPPAGPPRPDDDRPDVARPERIEAAPPEAPAEAARPDRRRERHRDRHPDRDRDRGHHPDRDRHADRDRGRDRGDRDRRDRDRACH